MQQTAKGLSSDLLRAGYGGGKPTFVSEEDLQKERERWQQHLDGAITTLKNGLSTQVEQLVKAATSSRGKSTRDLERTAILEADFKALRSEFSAVIAAAGEMTNTVKNEFQELRRNAGVDQLRAVQELAAREGIARGTLKSELKQEVQILRLDLEERIRKIAAMVKGEASESDGFQRIGEELKVLSAKLWTSNSQRTSNQGSAATSRQDTGFESDDTHGSLSHKNVARIVGEMDAELRIEFASRIKLVTAELRGELLGEVAARTSAVEAKLSVVASTCGAEIEQLGAALDVRINKEVERLGKRIAHLEMSAPSTAISLGEGSTSIQALGKFIAQELAASQGVSSRKIEPSTGAPSESGTSNAGSFVSGAEQCPQPSRSWENAGRRALSVDSAEARDEVSLKSSLTNLIKSIQRVPPPSATTGAKGVSEIRQSQRSPTTYKSTSPGGSMLVAAVQAAKSSEDITSTPVPLSSPKRQLGSTAYRYSSDHRVGLYPVVRSPGAPGVPMSAQVPGANVLGIRNSGRPSIVSHSSPVSGLVSR